ncbi:MAG: hypothetical protein DRG11_01560 [Epsilonproteobacteria bacterium]|nr:MAG: hypothetical protein DRG11_01560 [Campylobacterota bacterium]
MDNTFTKQFSFVLSLIIYFAIIFTLSKYILENEKQVIKANKHQTVIELDLSNENSKEVTKEATKAASKKSIGIKKLETKDNSASKTNKKTSDVKSLFSNVKIKATKTTKETITNKEKSEVSSRFKAKVEKNEKEDNTTKVSNNLNSSKQSQASLNAQNSGSTDEYYSKIYDILSNRWRPYDIRHEFSAQIVVYITKNGKFSYRFKKYSDSTDFDNQLMRFLDSQLDEIFPISKEENDVTIVVTFKTKN